MRLYEDFTSTPVDPGPKNVVEDDDDSEVEGGAGRPDLRWEDGQFHGHTLKALNQMRKDKHFCDVTLQIDKQDFPAHRAVLAAVSPYLLELFTSQRDLPTRKEVEGVTGVTYELNGGFSKEALQILIEYAYTARLNIPAKSIRSVFLAAIRLRMERVSFECAKFLAEHISLETCLELRNMPGITRLNDLVHKVDEYIQTNFKLIQQSRSLMTLPKICVEVIHNSKEDCEGAKSKALCQLALDWIHSQWLEDEKMSLDSLRLKTHLLYMGRENKLEDCNEIEEGSINDSELIQDYKKINQQLPRQTKKIRRHSSKKPLRPHEVLYSRHINQDEEKTEDVLEEWKVVACQIIDDKTILGLITVDGLLTVISLIQRLNHSASPDGTFKPVVAPSSLALAFGTGTKKGSKATSPAMSRPPSEEADLYAPLAAMNRAKCAVGTCELDGKLIVCGGYDRGECLNSVEAFSLETNSWSQLSKMLAKRGRFDITVLGGKIYAVAGSNGHSEQPTAERYDPVANKWSPLVNLPSPMANIGVTSVNGTLYSVGGTFGQSGNKTCFRYDEDENKWKQVASLQVGRSQGGVTSFQGKIWTVGGCDAWNPLASVEIYDPASNTWRMGPPMSTPRRGCGIVSKDGLLYVIGGSDGTQALCTTEIYEPRMNLWTPGPNMTTCRANVSAAVVGGRIWAVGGFNGKNFLSTMEFLDPRRDEWTTYISTKAETAPSAPRVFPFKVEQVEDTLDRLKLGQDLPNYDSSASNNNNVAVNGAGEVEKKVTIVEEPTTSTSACGQGQLM